MKNNKKFYFTALFFKIFLKNSVFKLKNAVFAKNKVKNLYCKAAILIIYAVIFKWLQEKGNVDTHEMYRTD